VRVRVGSSPSLQRLAVLVPSAILLAILIASWRSASPLALASLPAVPLLRSLLRRADPSGLTLQLADGGDSVFAPEDSGGCKRTGRLEVLGLLPCARWVRMAGPGLHRNHCGPWLLLDDAMSRDDWRRLCRCIRLRAGR
jgi:hypothetical protein